MKKPIAQMVYVGDFGQVPVNAETLEAYGLKSYPINRRSSTQRNKLKKLESNLAAIQEHTWLLGDVLDKA